ncbi:10091_t:CDS:2, partial [Acaulospora morrowiae]
LPSPKQISIPVKEYFKMIKYYITALGVNNNEIYLKKQFLCELLPENQIESRRYELELPLDELVEKPSKIENELYRFRNVNMPNHSTGAIGVEMSTNRPEIKPDREIKSDLKDEKQKNIALETKSGVDIDTSKLVTNNELEKYAERLGIKEYTENKDLWKKFYDVFGPDFVWPSTAKAGERREVFDYITYPQWEPTGEERARNTVEYRRLLESKTLDASKGSHILIINGKLVSYGNKISQEDNEKLKKKYPGCFYAPVVERTVLIRRFSAKEDQTRNEWQVCIVYNLIDDNKSHICIRNELNPEDEVKIASTEQNYRMIIDTGSTVTIIPSFVREQLCDPNDGWDNFSFCPEGYGGTAKIVQASREWLICLGDGTNWSNWVRTREVYSWQNNPPDVDCGLIGYDVLNNIPHYKPYITYYRIWQ